MLSGVGRRGVGERLQLFPLVHQVADLPHQRLVPVDRSAWAPPGRRRSPGRPSSARARGAPARSRRSVPRASSIRAPARLQRAALPFRLGVGLLLASCSRDGCALAARRALAAARLALRGPHRRRADAAASPRLSARPGSAWPRALLPAARPACRACLSPACLAGVLLVPEELGVGAGIDDGRAAGRPR